MKKSIIMVITIINIIVILTINTFAATIILPSVPSGSKYFFVGKYSDKYLLYVYTNPDDITESLDSNGIKMGIDINNCTRYELQNDKWVKVLTGTIFLKDSIMIYDSTGTYDKNTGIIFKIGYSDFDIVSKNISDQFKITSLISIVITGILISVGITFMFIMIRKMIKTIFNAFRKGKIKF